MKHRSYDTAIPWDYAVIELSYPLGDDIGWFGWGYLLGKQYRLAIGMAGYPSELPVLALIDTSGPSLCI